MIDHQEPFMLDASTWQRAFARFGSPDWPPVGRKERFQSGRLPVTLGWGITRLDVIRRIGQLQARRSLSMYSETLAAPSQLATLVEK